MKNKYQAIVIKYAENLKKNEPDVFRVGKQNYILALVGSNIKNEQVVYEAYREIMFKLIKKEQVEKNKSSTRTIKQ